MDAARKGKNGEQEGALNAGPDTHWHLPRTTAKKSARARTTKGRCGVVWKGEKQDDPLEYSARVIAGQ